MIAPFIEDISREFDGKAVVAKCDVDNNPGIVSKYGIRIIPTVLFFKNGQVADKQIGAVQKSNYMTKLNALL